MDGKQTPSEEPTWQFKPGETISPRQQPSPETSVTPPAAASPLTDSPPPAAAEPPSMPAAGPAPEAATPPSIPPATADMPAPTPEDFGRNDQSLTWTASEFIAHDKSAGWHTGLIAVALVAAVVFWFVTKDMVTSIVVVVAGVVLSLYGARRPGEQQYQIDNYGISIGQKHFSFNDFRAFSVVPEGAFASISLVPVKRFAPMTTLYFAPEDSDEILAILGNHLPEQPMQADAIDSLMRKIRF